MSDPPRVAQRSPARNLRRAVVAAMLGHWAIAAAIFAAAEKAPAAPAPRRVLVLQSFGNDFAPYNFVASHLRVDLAASWPAPIEFHEVTLEMARFGEAATEAPFVDYILALFAERRLDLVVPIGGAASSFTMRYRSRLFPDVPVLHVATDQRLLPAASLGSSDAGVPVALDLRGQVEAILALLPATENLAIVIGSSPLERYWHAELERALEPFAGRLHLSWLDNLSLDGVRKEVARLPPRSAVLFCLYLVDGAGVPHQLDTALEAVATAANAPVFGFFDNQLGHGVVGGRMVPLDTLVDRAVEAASRLLRGEAPSVVRYPGLEMSVPVFDARELSRWGIPPLRLPAGSEIRFAVVSPLVEYRWPLLGALGIVAAQSALIVALLAHRNRRRQAEGEIRTLHGRLLTTFEQERRRLARELHDDLTQRLARLAIDASQIERQGLAQGGGESLRRMRQELVKLSEDVHTLSRQLHPSILDELGLVDALRSEGERFCRDEQTEVALQLAEDIPDPAPDVALCLFRFAQEALRNVAHHARASRVAISLRQAGGDLELEVSDNGVGFEPDAQPRSPGLGHISLRERLHLVGGRLEIASARGRGTTVLARVPCAGGAS